MADTVTWSRDRQCCARLVSGKSWAEGELKKLTTAFEPILLYIIECEQIIFRLIENVKLSQKHSSISGIF